MYHADEYWAEALPLVLLRIRSAWKEDLKASSAELVYGSPLPLPAEFFASSPAECTHVTDFASRLRVNIGKVRRVPASRHTAPSTFIFKDLATASHVFLRHGALREPSKPRMSARTGSSTGAIRPIPSRFRVLAKTVSIDRLKPGYVLHVNTESASPPAIPSSITTRSGRRVRFPDCLGVQQSQRQGGGGGGRQWLAHPRSQDILLSIHHNLINIETESRVKWELKSGISV
jgi:hypothetical protein